MELYFLFDNHEIQQAIMIIHAMNHEKFQGDHITNTVPNLEFTDSEG